MNRVMLCGLIVTVFAVSLFTTNQAETSQNRKEYKKQKTAMVIKEETMGNIDPTKALVYVIRPTSFGFGVDTWTFCDDKPLGLNRGKSYFFAYVEPGNHIIWSKSENISPYGMNFQAGKTYYFVEDINLGVFSARVSLDPVSEEDGRAFIDKHEFKMLSPTEAGAERGKKLAMRNYAKVEKKWKTRQKKLERKDKSKH